jgi:hypothetical protein
MNKIDHVHLLLDKIIEKRDVDYLNMHDEIIKFIFGSSPMQIDDKLKKLFSKADILFKNNKYDESENNLIIILESTLVVAGVWNTLGLIYMNRWIDRVNYNKSMNPVDIIKAKFFF